jgi:hypothetical protein
VKKIRVRFLLIAISKIVFDVERNVIGYHLVVDFVTYSMRFVVDSSSPTLTELRALE